MIDMQWAARILETIDRLLFFCFVYYSNIVNLFIGVCDENKIQAPENGRKKKFKKQTCWKKDLNQPLNSEMCVILSVKISMCKVQK